MKRILQKSLSLLLSLALCLSLLPTPAYATETVLTETNETGQTGSETDLPTEADLPEGDEADPPADGGPPEDVSPDETGDVIPEEDAATNGSDLGSGDGSSSEEGPEETGSPPSEDAEAPDPEDTGASTEEGAGDGTEAPDAEPGDADAGTGTAEEETDNSEWDWLNIDPGWTWLEGGGEWVCVGTTIPNPMLRATASDTWGYFVKKYNPGDAGNYIKFQTDKYYGVNVHRAYNKTEDQQYLAYCLEMTKKATGSSSNMNTNYEEPGAMPTGAKYQIGKYAAALGYAGDPDGLAELKAIFGYTVNEQEAAQATQMGMWIAQYTNSRGYENATETISKFPVTKLDTVSTSSALKLAVDLADAALALYSDGISLSAAGTTGAEATGTVTIKFTVTAKNCFGGYTAKLTGLPAGCTITGSSKVTVGNYASSAYTLSSSQETGTDTISIVIPKAEAETTYTAKLAMSSVCQQYPNNGAVLFANAIDSDEQDMIIVGNDVLVAKSSSASLKVSLPALDTGKITVMKRDAVTGDYLAGAVFGLWEWQATGEWTGGSGKYVNTGLTATTDANGAATFTGLSTNSSNTGKYQVREITPPRGYELATFSCSAGITNGFYNYQSDFLQQSSPGTGFSGTAMGSINGVDRELVTSVPTDTGYDVTLYAYDTKMEIVPIYDVLTVKKISVDPSGSETLLSGLTFGLYFQEVDSSWTRLLTLEESDYYKGVYEVSPNEDGSYRQFTTDSWYKVVEEASPEGVVNSGWEQEFYWDETDVDLDLEFTCVDEIPTGSLLVRKTDEETGRPMEGVTFLVTAAKDISITFNGTSTLVHPAGTEIATLTTDADGYAYLDGLYYGTYAVTETATLEDYLFEPISFQVDVSEPANYAPTNTYPVSSAIGISSYSGVGTGTAYERYDEASYARYVKDSSGYVVRYSKTDSGYTAVAEGEYAQVAFAAVPNTPLHPEMAVAKLTDKTTDPNGGTVSFDAAAGRYTEQKVPGTYYNGQTVTFTLTATNNGNTPIHEVQLVDVFSQELWTVVQRSETSDGRTTDVTWKSMEGTELVIDSTVTTTQGRTATVTDVLYDDGARTYTLYLDDLEAGDSFSVLLTFTLYNYDNVNKDALPNDVYLYAMYLSNGTVGRLKEVPGGGEEDCQDDDAIDVVSTGTISIRKTDDRNRAMSGVVFRLTDSDGSAVSFLQQEDGSYAATIPDEATGDWISASQSGETTTTRLKTDSQGKLLLTGIPLGKYTLTEIETTAGHVLLSDPIAVTLPYTRSGSVDNDATYSLDGVNYYLDLTYNISNAVTLRLPDTGGTDSYWISAFGILLAGLAISSLFVFWRSERKNKYQFCKGESIMKAPKRILSLLTAIVMTFALTVSASAVQLSDATIDATKTGSLTIYKYDITSAEEAGLSDSDYLSTGRANETAAAAFADYAIEGVEFTYLKVGDIITWMNTTDPANQKIQVAYGISNADLITALGVTDQAVKTEGATKYFTSDTLIDALSSKLASNNTSTKDTLEAIIQADANAAAMPLTTADGQTSASDLPLGLYLVVETKVPEQVTSTVDPFFVSLPMTDTQALDQWQYDVVVYPKNQTGDPTLEKEVSDSAHGLAYGTATAGFADVATASSNDVLTYRLISTLPVIHSAATYFSEYKFVDTLSKGIEFNANEIKICWYEDYATAIADYTAATTEAAAVNGSNAAATWTFGSEFFTVAYGTDAADETSTTMTVALTEKGLAEVNAPTSKEEQEGKYSGWTMVIYYNATVHADADLVLGDSGNANDVVMTWRRTSTNYVDQLTDTTTVYSYGIDLTKEFSGDSTAYTDVQFVAKNTSNVTGEYFLLAAAEEGVAGVYYITGSTVNEADATRFSPDETGKLKIYGLEEDTYVLTEVKTASGYTLLKDSITIDLNTVYAADADADGCGTLSASGTVDGSAATMLAHNESVNALVPLTVLNTRGFDLPKTGGESTLIITVVGVLVVGLTLAMMVTGRRKESAAK